jgi:hypothetical protein
MSTNQSNTAPTSSNVKIQFDPKTRKPILVGGNPKGFQKDDFRAGNSKLKSGSPKSYIRRAGPRGG